MPLPPFAHGREWRRRSSHSGRLRRRVYFDRGTGFEYEKDPSKDTWHEIDPRRDVYREVSSETGEPLSGYHGTWRRLL